VPGVGGGQFANGAEGAATCQGGGGCINGGDDSGKGVGGIGGVEGGGVGGVGGVGGA